MGRNRNKNLFWYGFIANVKKFFGSVFFMWGGLMSLFSWALNSDINFIGVALMILGLYLILIGSSQRFDYQRQSGYIIHRGDR